MAYARSRRLKQQGADYWPGFVDAMATLLLVIIFLLSIFVVAQFFLSQEISGRDTVLNRLNAQIAELTELLALERANNRDLQSSVATLELSLAALTGERDQLNAAIEDSTLEGATATEQIVTLEDALQDEKAISRRALSQVEILNQQLAALRRQIAALEAALEASEDRDRESQTKIADLGRRLNTALAQRVQELSRYRSDFFGRLREILSARSDIRVVGDRFVFQSEVLFPSGSAEISTSGSDELSNLASALRELEQEIPDDIDWVLRVDGHTDARPLSGSGKYANNWELSAGRAISVVRYLVDAGVSADRLVAAGFGEFQPLEEGDTIEAYNRNRRIELKLTER